jgi:peroxiredoxin 2/4
MKRSIEKIFLIIILFLTSVSSKAIASALLSKKCQVTPQIGDRAPQFSAQSTKGTITFPQDYTGKWVIFFSHPADFTPICATEFKKLARMLKTFDRLNTKLLGLSVDSAHTHDRWMKSLEKDLDESHRIDFPVIADTTRRIAHAYGMIHPRASTIQTVRSVYFIDPQGIVRAVFHYPITNGRNFDEIKRLLIALQTTDKKNVITPVNWQPGQKAITKLPKSKDALPEYQ